MLSFTIVALNLLGAQMVEMAALDESCWTKIYQQSGITWYHTIITTCSVDRCSYSPFTSSDYLYLDDLSEYNDNGFGFYMKWDDIYFLTWKQMTNPLLVNSNYTENLLVGDYSHYGVSKTIFQYGSELDFRGLGLSADVGALLDGRGNGSWFVVTATDGISVGTDSGIPGWKNVAGNFYMTNTAVLYVWNTMCGSWVIPSMSDPPTAIPTANPSPIPTPVPSASPTLNPTASPTDYPTVSPTTSLPSNGPSSIPSPVPTSKPTRSPTITPSFRPSTQPTWHPTFDPTPRPSTSAAASASQVTHGNEKLLLYMLVGFSVGGFLVLLIVVLLYWRRYEAHRHDEIKKTIVELSKMTSHRASSLRESGVSLELEYANTKALAERNSTSSFSRSLSNIRTSTVGFDPVNSYDYIEGRPSNHSLQLPRPTMRKSLSRSKTHTYTPDWVMNQHGDLEGLEFSYPSKTTDEGKVIPKWTNKPMRISPSPRMKVIPPRKIMEWERESWSINGESENESENSETSGLKMIISGKDEKFQEGKLLSKEQTSTYLQDYGKDRDAVEFASQKGSGSKGDRTSRTDSRVLPAKIMTQGATSGEGHATRGELSKLWAEYSRDPQSSRSLDEHNSFRPDIYTLSKTYSDTSHHKDISKKDKAENKIPLDIDLYKRH